VTGAFLADLGTNAALAGPSAGTEQIAFWVLAPLALLGAVGMVLSRGAVHSALWLVLTMLSLGGAYMVQQAEFLGFVQIIVYTGAIMMLFLFVLMLTGRDAGDSVFEVLRHQRVAAACVGIGLVALIATGLVRSLEGVTVVGLDAALAERGPVGSIAAQLFTDRLFPFELTSALLITAATGAMVLTHVERSSLARKSQRQRVAERMVSGHMSPLPGPGVFATSSSNATPAMLPDGSIAPGSVSELVEQGESERVARGFRAGRTSTDLVTTDHPLGRPEELTAPSRQPAGFGQPDGPGAPPADDDPFGGAAGLAPPEQSSDPAGPTGATGTAVGSGAGTGRQPR
jgi:NADH-quinone oxidoreductase subunit J